MNDAVSQILGDQSAEPQQAAPLLPDASSSILNDTPDHGRLSVAVQTGVQAAPAQHAKIFEMAKQSGLPQDVVQRNTEAVNQAIKGSQFDTSAIMASNPKTGEWLASDPVKAGMAQDALPDMKGIEDVVNGHGWAVTTGQSVLTNYAKGAGKAVAGVGQIPSLIDTMRQASMPGVGGPPEFQQMVHEGLKDNPIYRAGKEAEKYWDNPELQRQSAESTTQLLKSGQIGEASKKFLTDVAGGMPTIMSLIAAPETLLPMAAGSAAESTEKGVQAGMPAGQASALGLAHGAIFMAGSELGTLSPLRAYEHVMEQQLGTAVGQSAFRSMLTNAVKSYAGTISAGAVAGGGMALGDSLVDKYIGGDQHALDDIGQKIMEAMAIGGATNAAVGAGTIGAAVHERSIEINTAEHNKAMMQALETKFEASGLTKLSRAAAIDHVTAVLQGSHIAEAYTPAADFKEFFQSQGTDPLEAASRLGVAKEYVDAEKSGTDFKIPTAKIIEQFSGTPLYQKFSEHLKFSPEEVTPSQAKEIGDQMQAQDQEAQPVQDGAARGGEVVKNQLLAAGENENVADSVSKIWEERSRTRAERRGQADMGPRELLQQWPVRIERAGQAPLEINSAQENPRELLAGTWAQMSHGEKLPLNFIDPVTQTLNKRAFEAMPVPEGKGMVAHISVEGTKHANDELGGHAAGDEVYRTAGQALLRVAPTVAKVGGDFALHVADKAELDQILKAANEHMPGAIQLGGNLVNGKAFKFSGEVGPDLNTAAASHVEAKVAAEEAGARSKRGEAPAGIKAPQGAKAERLPSLQPEISPELQAAHEGMSPEKVFEAVNFDKPSGMLSDEGFRQMPKKKFQASIDLNFLKKVNDMVGAEGGDKLLRAFEKEIKLLAKEEGLELNLAHKSGDEYLAQHDDSKKMEKFFSDLTDRLHNVNIKLSNGMILKGISFGAGIGGSDAIAERNLHESKNRQEDRRAAGPDIRPEDGLAQGAGVQAGRSADRRSYVVASHEEVPLDPNSAFMARDRAKAERAMRLSAISDAGGLSPITDFTSKLGGLDHESITESGNAGAYPDKSDSKSLYLKNGNKPERVLEALIEEGIMPKGSTEGDYQQALNAERKAVADFKANEGPTAMSDLRSINARKAAGQIKRFDTLGQKSEKLGSYTPTPEGAVIRLMKNANASTALHESWHHFYHEMAQDVEYVRNLDPEQHTPMQKQLVADFDTVLKTVGAKSFETMTRAQHEKLAKWGEEYMREGKAPSEALRPVFDRFRSWLIGVYRNVKNLLQGDPGVNDEMRGVMDRMLASDNAIKEAQNVQGPEPMPGLSDPKYAKALEEAHAAAMDRVSEKAIAQWHRTRKAEWKAERKVHFEDALKEVNQRREYIALNELQRGVDADGKKMSDPPKLDRAAIISEFGKDVLKGLPDDIFAKDGELGAAPDMAASHYGYDSPLQMLKDLANRPPAERLAGETADAAMDFIHGNILTDGSMPTEALEAVHNDKRAAVLRYELEHIAKNNLPALKGMIQKVSRRPIPFDAMKSSAAFIIGDKATGDIKPELYLRAENKLRRLAGDTFTKGDMAAAFDAKQKEALNHELYRSASDAQAQVKKISDYFKKFDQDASRKRVGKAGEKFMQAIDYIRGLHNFGDGGNADNRAGLVALLKSQERAGNPMTMPDSVMGRQEAVGFKDATFSDVSDSYKAARMIEHLANESNKLLKAHKDAMVENMQRDLETSVKAIHGDGFGGDKGAQHDYDPGLMETMNTARRRGVSWMLRPLNIISEIDGHKANGVAYNMLWEPKQRAEVAENSRMREFRDAEKNVIYKDYSRQEKALLFLRKEYIPEIKQSLTKERMLMIMANRGNEENLKALNEGNKYTPEQLDAIAKHMEPRDLEMVRQMWKHIDSYWSDIKDQEFRLRGVAPDKVAAKPFSVTLADGSVHEMPGGYFPLLFDRARAPVAKSMEDVKNVGEMFGGEFVKWMTADGHTKERVDHQGVPVKLDLDGFTRHVASVIHDLSYRETLIDLHKLVNDPSIKDSIVRAVSKEKWDELNPWIGRMAGAGPYDPMDSIAGWMRHSLTSSILAYRISVGLKHAGSEFTTIHELGPEYAFKGLSNLVNLPKLRENFELMHELSPYMKDRNDAGDREMHDFVRGRGLLNKPGLLASLTERVVGGEVGAKAALADAWKKEAEMTYFAFVRMVDKATAMATWTGTYSKAMDGKIPGITAGDHKSSASHANRMVQEVKGAGAPGDLPRILAGNDWMHLFTMFMTQRNVIFNQHAKSVQQGESNWAKGGVRMAAPAMISALMLKWAIPAIWNKVVTKGVPSNDEEKNRLAMETAAYPAEGVPLATDAIRYAMAKYGENRSVEITIPPFELMQQAVQTGHGLYAQGWGDGMTHEEAKSAAAVAGALFRLPGPQMFTLLDYINSRLDGQADGTSVPEDVWRATVAGRKR